MYRPSFLAADTDQDGYLSPTELKRAVIKLGIAVSHDEFYALVQYMDRSKNGKVSYEDFVASVL